MSSTPLTKYICQNCGQAKYSDQPINWTGYCGPVCRMEAEHPEWKSCRSCGYIICCGPLRMAVNTPQNPCKDYFEKRKDND